MSPWAWLSLHHAFSILTFVLTIALAFKVLRSRRPASASTAWLLGIVLVPYVGIPLYLIFGDRKLKVASKKPVIALARKPTTAPGSVEIAWLDRPATAFEAVLREIRGAKRSIHISTFILGDDEVGRAIVAALILRAKDGVEVCLMLDGLFSRLSPSHALASCAPRVGGSRSSCRSCTFPGAVAPTCGIIASSRSSIRRARSWAA